MGMSPRYLAEKRLARRADVEALRLGEGANRWLQRGLFLRLPRGGRLGAQRDQVQRQPVVHHLAPVWSGSDQGTVLHRSGRL